jgi:hypothetical protein
VGTGDTLGIADGLAVGATALGTDVGSLVDEAVADGTSDGDGDGSTATVVGVGLGEDDGSVSDGDASVGAGVARTPATSPPPAAGGAAEEAPTALRSCWGGNAVPTATARTTRPRLTPPRATTSRWRCVGDSWHLP